MTATGQFVHSEMFIIQKSIRPMLLNPNGYWFSILYLTFLTWY